MKNIIFSCCCVLLFFVGCQKTEHETNTGHAEKTGKGVTASQELLDHNHEFNEEEVIEVSPGVHVAIGFGLANSIMIEGENGNIIVDCTESDQVAERVLAAFKKISNKPIKALIYTHNHTDHIFGSGVFAGDDNPDVYAHELTNYYIDRIVSIIRPVIGLRSYRMFGVKLDKETRVNCGIGPYLDANDESTRSLARPTITFSDHLETTIEGVKIKLVHAPGETDDQIYVWLPERKILFPGDNFYKAFPNLYTIRGTGYRDVKAWASSLDKMRYLEPEIVVPSHTQPIKGKEEIQAILTDYADAIRFVHDQTIRYMNKGYTAEEIANLVVLPDHLKDSPYLQEFYGKVNWSVKNIFNGYLGWFDGNATTLLPLSPTEKAEKMAKLVGGEAQLLTKAQEALDQEQYQWALELSDHLMKLDDKNQSGKGIRHTALQALGEKQSNPNARSYYLSQALEAQGKSIDIVVKRDPALVHSIPLETLFNGLAVNIIPEKAAGYNKKAVFKMTDTGESWSVHIRNGVAEIQPFALPNADIAVTTTSIVWKEVVGKLRDAKGAIANGELKIEGGITKIPAFGKFMGMFRE